MELIKINQITRDKSVREIVINPRNITYIFVKEGRTMIQFVGPPDNGIAVKENIETISKLIATI